MFTIGTALVMGGVALLTVFGDDGLVHRHLRVRQIVSFEQEIASLEEQNFRLRLAIRRLRDRETALERAAASDLQMARPEAVIYQFPADADPGAGDGTAPPAEAEGAGRRLP